MTLFSTSKATAQCSPQELIKLTGSDAAASDQFGYSVSISASTAVIGAPFDDNSGGTDAGAAYVFTGSGAVWTEQAKLTPLDAAASDQFGFSVAVSGDTAVVGAYLDNHAGGSDAGSAYVFVRSGTTWTEQAKLIALDAQGSDWFGSTVAIDGDTIVIGAQREDPPGGTNAGAAYVFVRSGTVWTQQAKLTASDGAAQDRFGIAVAVHVDTTVIGAEADDQGLLMDTGAAYVFVRAGTSWSEQGKLTLLNAAANTFLGISAAVDGDTALIGANRDDLVGGADAGSAYVFTRSAGVWTQATGLSASDGAASDFFGDSVALSGNTALVGAAFDDIPAGSETGSAYVFFGAGNSWSEQDKLLASDAAATDYFGRSVALDGDIAIIGARQDDHAAGANAGAAYVFVLNCNVDGDLDGDGDSDADDTEIFVSVLLGLDMSEDHIIRADVNGSGQPDGLDIEPFVQAQTGV
ncbi:MAG TPA: FG-GAP repeat protein [Phycisphaerae bacterium]|nr:FG-GAP repeat protein [Phycisphaerae bacterium]